MVAIPRVTFFEYGPTVSETRTNVPGVDAKENQQNYTDVTCKKHSREETSYFSLPPPQLILTRIDDRFG